MKETLFFIALRKQIPGENLKVYSSFFLNQHSKTPSFRLIYTDRAHYPLTWLSEA